MSSENTGSRAAAETTWDAEAYAANTAHHRLHDEPFLGSTPLEPSMTVVDVGCGSGDFTRILAETVPNGVAIGIDPQPDLIDLARQNAHPNQRFRVGGAQDLARLLGEMSVDAVVSRAALHWVPWGDHPRSVRGMFRVLHPGGLLRIEMGGAGNIGRVAEMLGGIAARHGGPRYPWTFPTEDEYRALLVASGFEIEPRGFVRLEPQRRSFDEHSFAGWMESQVLNAFEAGFGIEAREAFRAEVAGRRRELMENGEWDQEFVRLQVLAFKPL